MPASEVITFACTNSPLTKCVRLGYKPWKTVDGVSLRDHHLACARMMRADYCGDGHAHTREGTLVHFYDRLRRDRRWSSLSLNVLTASAAIPTSMRPGLMKTPLRIDGPKR